MNSAFAGQMILSSTTLGLLKPVENKYINVEKEMPANAVPPTQGHVLPCFDPYNPLDKWELTWKKNYFAVTQNIYEPRGDKFICKECGAPFPSRLSILTHSKIHLKPFCVVCMEYKTTKSEMEFHMYQDHNGLTYYKNTLSFAAGGRNAGNAVTENKVKTYLNKNRLKKASTVPPLKQSPEHITKIVTSRFGRCITVKLPDF